MVHSSPLPATAHACLRAVLRADAAGARAWLGLGGLLLLAVLVRLFGRAEAEWEEWDGEDAPSPRYIVLPTMGRAPHAACIEAGLVPDWVLPGVRNRGMRPKCARPRPRRSTRAARAPPCAPLSWPENTPAGGRRLTPPILP